jgi:hypothetical protein
MKAVSARGCLPTGFVMASATSVNGCLTSAPLVHGCSFLAPPGLGERPGFGAGGPGSGSARGASRLVGRGLPSGVDRGLTPAGDIERSTV